MLLLLLLLWSAGRCCHYLKSNQMLTMCRMEWHAQHSINISQLAIFTTKQCFFRGIISSVRNQLQFDVWWLTTSTCKWSMIDYNPFEIGIKIWWDFSASYQYCGIILVIYFFQIPVTMNCWSKGWTWVIYLKKKSILMSKKCLDSL